LLWISVDFLELDEIVREMSSPGSWKIQKWRSASLGTFSLPKIRATAGAIDADLTVRFLYFLCNTSEILRRLPVPQTIDVDDPHRGEQNANKPLGTGPIGQLCCETKSTIGTTMVRRPLFRTFT